jgi:hypothetical protein
LLALLLLLALPFVLRAAGGSSVLLLPAGPPAGQVPSVEPAVVAEHYVTVNWRALDNGAAETLVLELPGDRRLTATRLRRDPVPQLTGYVWVGAIPGGTVTLSVLDIRSGRSAATYMWCAK